MRRLMLLRHAKAVPQGVLADENRPLAERGRADTPKIAEFAVSRGLLPDLAVVSASLRTRETWELFAVALPAQPAHRIDARLYSASAERILYLMRETTPDVGTLLMIGHNPGFEEVARALTGSGDTDALIRFGGTMPTASLAVIDLPGDWTRVEPRTGRLEFFVTPKSLGGGED
jgi:phosphohistidine phosphatase